MVIKVTRHYLFASILALTIVQTLSYQFCRNGSSQFELITGYAYTTSTDLMRLIPGSLELTQCLAYCQINDTCKAINYETGLCVLLSTSALQRPESLKPSQFPVFTIYAQKICMPSTIGVKCNRAWVYERVIGYRLRTEAKKIIRTQSHDLCMDHCLRDSSVDCRAANYNPTTGECFFLSNDRHSFSYKPGDIEINFTPDSNFDFLENNCIQDNYPNKICEFKKINGMILKTVDSIHPNVDTIDKCKDKCLNGPYRCHSFDFGDGTHRVCRTSHLSRFSSAHIKDPYLEANRGTTYELDNCYNVSLICGAREMKVNIKMNHPFTGKIYATSKPNSCYSLIKRKQEFDIAMPYNDINCGLVQSSTGRYSNNIVIQHHELIVTSNDVGLSINCQYDLSNREISHNIQMQDMAESLNEYLTEEEINRAPIQEATVTSPTVIMRITDRDGNDARSAEVGDYLSLRFEIPDITSPYEIFVREVIADDGVDASEFILIDERGCPVDVYIMGGVRRVKNSPKSLEAPFEAFKFPTSGIVQFRALVVPCLPSCEPVQCSLNNYDGTRKKVNSLGRRKRSDLESTARNDTKDNEMIVIQTIQIVDKFPHNKSSKMENKDTLNLVNETEHQRSSKCLDIDSLVALCFIFLTIQLVVISTWGYIKYKNRYQREHCLFKTKLTTGYCQANLFVNRPNRRSLFSLNELKIQA